MTLIIELDRIGMSRVSYEAIPLRARILQGGKYGENLVEKQKPTDVIWTQGEIQRMMDEKFRSTVTINWIDKTHGGK